MGLKVKFIDDYENYLSNPELKDILNEIVFHLRKTRSNIINLNDVLNGDLENLSIFHTLVKDKLNSGIYLAFSQLKYLSWYDLYLSMNSKHHDNENLYNIYKFHKVIFDYIVDLKLVIDNWRLLYSNIKSIIDFYRNEQALKGARSDKDLIFIIENLNIFFKAFGVNRFLIYDVSADFIFLILNKYLQYLENRVFMNGKAVLNNKLEEEYKLDILEYINFSGLLFYLLINKRNLFEKINDSYPKILGYIYSNYIVKNHKRNYIIDKIMDNLKTD